MRRRVYWSEEGVERNALLKSIFELLEREGWSYSADTGWKEWDIQIYGNFWWSITLQTVTEYHGGAKCLTRAGLRYRFVPTTILINTVYLSLIAYHALQTGHLHYWVLGLYFVFVLFLAVRAQRLRSRVAEIVDLAAHRAGLQRIRREKPAVAAKVEATAEAG